MGESEVNNEDLDQSKIFFPLKAIAHHALKFRKFIVKLVSLQKTNQPYKFGYTYIFWVKLTGKVYKETENINDELASDVMIENLLQFIKFFSIDGFGGD